MRDSYGGMSFWRHKKTRQDFTGNLLIPSYHVYLWSSVDVLCSDQPTGKEKVHTWNLFWMFFYQLLCKPSYKFTFLSFVRSNINKNVLTSILTTPLFHDSFRIPSVCTGKHADYPSSFITQKTKILWCWMQKERCSSPARLPLCWRRMCSAFVLGAKFQRFSTGTLCPPKQKRKSYV